MPNKIKKLYFTNDFSPENVKKLESDGWILRNASLAKSDSFVEQADEYGGEVPSRYKNKESVAAADCEKLQTENTDLISDLKTALDAKDQVQAKLTETEGQLSAVQTENTELKAKIAELEKVAVKKPTAAELKAAKAAEEAKAEQSQE